MFILLWWVKEWFYSLAKMETRSGCMPHSSYIVFYWLTLCFVVRCTHADMRTRTWRLVSRFRLHLHRAKVQRTGLHSSLFARIPFVANAFWITDCKRAGDLIKMRWTQPKDISEKKGKKKRKSDKEIKEIFHYFGGGVFFCTSCLYSDLFTNKNEYILLRWS